MARYPCDTETLTATVTWAPKNDGSPQRCANVDVLIAIPRTVPSGFRQSVSILSAIQDSAGNDDGGMTSQVRSTSDITHLVLADSVGNLAVESYVNLYAPPTPLPGSACFAGINGLTKVEDHTNPLTLVTTPGGLAMLLVESDDIEPYSTPFNSCGTVANQIGFRLKITDCVGNALSRIKTTNTNGVTTGGWGLFFSAEGCINAEIITAPTNLGVCTTEPIKQVKLSLDLLATPFNSLQCLDGKAAVLIRQFGAGIQLNNLPRAGGLAGTEIVADGIPSRDADNLLSITVDCGTTPGETATGRFFVGAVKDSKSMVWSNKEDDCSIGRQRFDAKLKLTDKVLNPNSGADTNGAKLTADGYWFNPEIAGSISGVENAAPTALFDGVPNNSSFLLQLDVINPSSVRSAIAILNFRSALTIAKIKSGLYYRIQSIGFITSSLNVVPTPIGQDTYRIDTRSGYTGGTWDQLVGSYSEIVTWPLVPGEKLFLSLVMKLENLGGVAINTGDVLIGSYEINAAVTTVGVDGPRGINQGLIGALPQSVAALP
jgi:hypothetical protein